MKFFGCYGRLKEVMTNFAERLVLALECFGCVGRRLLA